MQAQLAGVQLIADGVVSKSNIEIYTFGSPRVGDKKFAFEFDRVSGFEKVVQYPFKLLSNFRFNISLHFNTFVIASLLINKCIV